MFYWLTKLRTLSSKSGAMEGLSDDETLDDWSGADTTGYGQAKYFCPHQENPEDDQKQEQDADGIHFVLR